MQQKLWGTEDAVTLEIQGEQGASISVSANDKSLNFEFPSEASSGNGNAVTSLNADIRALLVHGSNEVHIQYVSGSGNETDNMTLVVTCDFEPPSAQVYPASITPLSNELTVNVAQDDSEIELSLLVDGKRAWSQANARGNISIGDIQQYGLQAADEICVELRDSAGNVLRLPLQFLDLMPLTIEDLGGEDTYLISVQGSEAAQINVTINAQTLSGTVGEPIDISTLLEPGDNSVLAQYQLSGDVSDNVYAETSATIHIIIDAGDELQIQLTPPQISEDTTQLTVTTHNAPEAYGVYLLLNGEMRWYQDDIRTDEVVIDDLRGLGIDPSGNISVIITDYNEEHQPIEIALQKIKMQFYRWGEGDSDIYGWVFGNQSELSADNISVSLIDAEGNEFSCTCTTQAQDFDEALEESGLQALLSTYFDSAWHITDIHYPSDCPAGSYMLQITCTLNSGDAWMFNQGEIIIGQ